MDGYDDYFSTKSLKLNKHYRSFPKLRSDPREKQ